MNAARGLLVILSLVTVLVCSSLLPSDLFSRPFRLENIQCHENSPNSIGWYDRQCCWDQYDVGTGASMGTFCQTCTLRSDGSITSCGDVICPSGNCMRSRSQELNNMTVAPEPEGILQPPTFPKGGPGNLLPEGVFEGPTTSPEGPQGLTPQVDCTQNPNDPLCETATIPEGEIDNETQGRLIGQPSPTGSCVPLRTPTCIPCDPGLPGNTCIPVSEWPPARTADTETSTEETTPQGQEDTSPEEDTARIPEGEIEEPQQPGEDTARIPEGEIEEPQQDDN